LGYSYQTAYEQFSASGQFKYNALGNSTLYSAAGVKLDWLTNLSKKLNVKLELEIEQQSYQPQHYSYQSGTQLANYNTLWYQLNEQWLLFGGLDYSKKNNSEQVHAYQLFSSRFGVNKRWSNGVETTFFASLRSRKYEQYSALLAQKRKDLE
ncbi:surface lipoprotein assembly modifier, partial [Pseudoalteromonas sp. AOP7-A1-14]